jgi:hypothetical protein
MPVFRGKIKDVSEIEIKPGGPGIVQIQLEVMADDAIEDVFVKLWHMRGSEAVVTIKNVSDDDERSHR